jgi:hypothetical protein
VGVDRRALLAREWRGSCGTDRALTGGCDALPRRAAAHERQRLAHGSRPEQREHRGRADGEQRQDEKQPRAEPRTLHGGHVRERRDIGFAAECSPRSPARTGEPRHRAAQSRSVRAPADATTHTLAQPG